MRNYKLGTGIPKLRDVRNSELAYSSLLPRTFLINYRIGTIGSSR